MPDAGQCRPDPAQGRTAFFFEAQAFAAHELPDGIVRHPDAACGQLVLQAMQGQMRCLLDPLDDESAVRLQNRPTMATHLAGRHAAGCPIALRPLHHRRDGNVEPIRHNPATLTSLNRSNNTLTKIIGIGSRHGCWPPIPASMINHISTDLGIPVRFRQAMIRSSSEGGFYDYEKFRWTVNSTNWKGFVLWYLICALVYACLLREWFGWW